MAPSSSQTIFFIKKKDELAAAATRGAARPDPRDHQAAIRLVVVIHWHFEPVVDSLARLRFIIIIAKTEFRRGRRLAGPGRGGSRGRVRAVARVREAGGDERRQGGSRGGQDGYCVGPASLANS